MLIFNGNGSNSGTPGGVNIPRDVDIYEGTSENSSMKMGENMNPYLVEGGQINRLDKIDWTNDKVTIIIDNPEGYSDFCIVSPVYYTVDKDPTKVVSFWRNESGKFSKVAVLKRLMNSLLKI